MLTSWPADSLHTRYVEPIKAESAIGGALLATVETCLSRRRSIPETAAALSIHVNTLRYRLERYAALTEADLQDTETIFEVWWALQYRNLYESPIGVADVVAPHLVSWLDRLLRFYR